MTVTAYTRAAVFNLFVLFIGARFPLRSPEVNPADGTLSAEPYPMEPCGAKPKLVALLSAPRPMLSM
ncbi:hypothetical protein [Streptomyces sp. NBC_00306]|uniref:hypothetical protein n=1 Tax=Streptomyces sp. NBC_00306 TaxID=2975708 RepID=UPI002E2C1102|nr:hypothetical protein [Streptomyces sp. NBC_00306]